MCLITASGIFQKVKAPQISKDVFHFLKPQKKIPNFLREAANGIMGKKKSFFFFLNQKAGIDLGKIIAFQLCELRPIVSLLQSSPFCTQCEISRDKALCGLGCPVHERDDLFTLNPFQSLAPPLGNFSFKAGP